MKGKIDLDDLTSQFKEVDSSVIDMAKSVQDGSMSMDEFTEKSTKPLLLLLNSVEWQKLLVPH